MTRELQFAWLGRVPYAHAWAVQRALVEDIYSGARPSTLLLLEHDPVFSMGRGADPGNLIWDAGERSRRGVELQWSDRGGDVTFHGPGQLVGYPVADLRVLQTDIISFLRRLEGTLIDLLRSFGIESEAGGRGLTGVWTRGPQDHPVLEVPEKIAAIGVKLNHHSVTSHGFALNVAPDLRFFEGIVGCGLAGRRATSMAALGVEVPSIESVAASYVACFEHAFEVRARPVSPAGLLGLAAGAPPAPEPLSDGAGRLAILERGAPVIRRG